MGTLLNAACVSGVFLGLALNLDLSDFPGSTGASSLNPPVLPGDAPEPLRPGRSKLHSATYSANQYGQFWIVNRHAKRTPFSG